VEIMAENVENNAPPVTIFHIVGDISAKTFSQLQTQAKEAHDSGVRNLLLDLSEVPYVSSAGLRAFHYMFKLLQGDSPQESDEAVRKGLGDGTFKSLHFKLLKPTGHVLEVLKTSGYDMFLEIHDKQDKAIASFG